VELTKECGCFTRSGMQRPQSSPSREEARQKAEAMMATIKATFCKRHRFTLEEDEEGFVIRVEAID